MKAARPMARPAMAPVEREFEEWVCFELVVLELELGSVAPGGRMLRRSCLVLSAKRHGLMEKVERS